MANDTPRKSTKADRERARRAWARKHLKMLKEKRAATMGPTTHKQFNPPSERKLPSPAKTVTERMKKKKGN